MTEARVLVLGSGIAGLVAAWELALRGLRPLVLEAAPIAGGRTSTYRDAGGRFGDTGLHVVADHYVNLQEVLARLGVSERLYWVGQHTYLRAGHAPMAWYFSPYKPPFHLLRPARAMPLSLKSRAGLGRASMTLASMTQADLAELDGVTYLEWHRANGLGDDFVLELAEAASDAATFLPVSRASARAVISWLKYLMRHRRAGDVGLFRGTLAECMIDPLTRAITAAGGEVRLSTAVRRLVLDDRNRVTGVVVARSRATGPVHNADGAVTCDAEETTLPCEAVVSALSLQGLRALLDATGPHTTRALGLADAMTLTTTPALSLILTFDRKIRPMPDGAPLCTGVAMRDFVDFECLQRAPYDAPGSVYQFVITRADERIDDPADRIITDITRDLVSVWPSARGARVVDAALERIGSAMFAALPGAHKKRPGVATRAPNLHLAGDFTHHELNASMEGAAFSGRRAADALLRARGLAGLDFTVLDDPTVSHTLRGLRQRFRREFFNSAG